MRSSRTHVLLPSRRVRSLARRIDEAVSAGVRDEPWRQVVRERGPSCEGPRVPGTGFEPVFLGSEASVLPARRSRSRRTARRARARTRRRSRVVRRGGRSGGDRTLTSPGKSRVRFQLRYGPVVTSIGDAHARHSRRDRAEARARIARVRDRSGARGVAATRRAARGTRGDRTLIPRLKRPVLDRLS